MSVLEHSTEIEVAIDAIWKGMLEVVDRYDPAIKPHLQAWLNAEIGAVHATRDLEQRLHRELSVRDPAVAAEALPIRQDSEAQRLKERLLKLLRQSLRED